MASATFTPAKGDFKTSEPMEKAKEAVDKAKEAGVQMIDKAKEAGAQVFDKTKEAGAQAYGKAKEAVESVGEMASQAASAVGKKADDWTAVAGHEIEAAGTALGKKAPHEGMTGHASQAIAETIKESGKYIEDAKLSGMAHDITEVVKNHPIPTMLICLGIGFCVARAFRD